MLKVNIEFLTDDKHRALWDAWDEDYIYSEGGRRRRRRALLLKKAIELVDPKTAIELSDKAEPIKERLALRYYLTNRRLKKGKYSILELLNWDSNYFSPYYEIVSAVSDLLSIREKDPSNKNTLNYVGDELDNLIQKSSAKKRYGPWPPKDRFEEQLGETLKWIVKEPFAFGSPIVETPNYRDHPFLMDYPTTLEEPFESWRRRVEAIGNHDRREFNHRLYDESCDLLHLYREQFVYEKIAMPKRKDNFFGNWQKAGDHTKERQREIHNKYLSFQKFEVVMKEDLKSFLDA